MGGRIISRTIQIQNRKHQTEETSITVVETKKEDQDLHLTKRIRQYIAARMQLQCDVHTKETITQWKETKMIVTCEGA